MDFFKSTGSLFPAYDARRPIRILLVEDNPADVRLTRELFDRGFAPSVIEVAEDGECALAYLQHKPPYSGVSTPDLILLDLNLPRLSGRELLAEIKRDPALAAIPVMVLSSSGAAADILAAYELRAISYIMKPADRGQVRAALGSIDPFWLNPPA